MMMKKLCTIIALTTAALVGAALVEAGQCPMLIKQLREAKLDDPTKGPMVKRLTDEAEMLHKTGRHAESVAKAEEAAKVAGMQLMKKPN